MRCEVLLSRHILAVVALAVMVFGIGAGHGLTSAQAGPLAQPEDGVTLRLAMPAPDTIDPILVSRFDQPARDLVENLFVGLTRFDPVTQTIQPAVAESWTVSDDQLTWTFTLRDDLHWVRYDAARDAVVAVRPVVAGDFVYSIQRACDPLRPSPHTANLMIIRGCQTVSRAFPEVVNDLFIAREIGVRATSPTTLEIDLLFPASYFLTLTSTRDYRPIPREAVTGPDDWTAGAPLIGNGPFVLRDRSASGMALVRNPEWPLPVAGNVAAVDIAFAAQPAPEFDWAALDGPQLSAAQARSPEQVHTAPEGPVVMLGFSHDRAVVNTDAGRRALSFALDRGALVQQIFEGRAEPLAQFTPPGNVAQPAFDGLMFDPSRAQQALVEAGLEGCNAIPETLLALVPDDDPAWTALGEAIVQQWADAPGCNPQLFEVRPLPRTLMIELAHNTYDFEKVTRSHIWLATWSADYPDGVAWIGDALHCRYGYIQPGRECGPADALLDRASVADDESERGRLLAEAEEAFFGAQGSFPVAPLFVMTRAWLEQPWLTGVNPTGPARYDLWTVNAEARPAS